MGRKILLISLVLIVAGLALLVVSDPLFRTISSGSGFTPGGSGGFAGSSIFEECRTVTNETVQQCLSNNGISFAGFGGGNGNFTGVRSSIFAFNTNSVTEGVGGIGLIAIGSILVLVQLFKMPAASASGKKWRKYRQ